jgi:hypothetical protein
VEPGDVLCATKYLAFLRERIETPRLAEPALRTLLPAVKEAQLAVVVLMNTSPAPISPAGVGGALAREVLPWKRPTMTYFTGEATQLVGKYQLVMGGNISAITVEVTQTPTGLAFAPSGQRPEPLPWAGGLTFYPQENVTLTFRRANGNSGPVTELRRDDPGNHAILKKQ